MFDWFRKKTPAQKAGRAAARAWLKISEQTDEDVEVLTGKTLLRHAQEEARQWLRSTYTYEKHGSWNPDDRRNPEQKRHPEFLEYVEAFMTAFPREWQGVPKMGREEE